MQGFAIFKQRVGISYLRAALPGAHWEVANHPQAAEEYCEKEDTRVAGPWRRGMKPAGQGARTDLAAGCDLVKKGGIKALIDEAPDLFVKYSRGFEALDSAINKPTGVALESLRPWQQIVVDTLSERPDNRTVFFITDKDGGKGKSALASHLITVHPTIIFDSGRVQDMAKAWADYKPTPTLAIFDLARCQEGSVKHFFQFAEQLKNGRCFSPKYTSQFCTFPAPHVVFFTNFEPDYALLSRDRWRVMDLMVDNQWRTADGQIIHRVVQLNEEEQAAYNVALHL